MSLLRDITDASMGTVESLASILRRCKVLAARLDYQPLAQWADLELGGYEDPGSLPAYRTSTVGVFADLEGPWGASAKRIAIRRSSLPELLHEREEDLFTARVYDGIAAIEDLVASGEASFELPWPPECFPLMSGRVLVGYQVMTAYRSLPRGTLVQILDTVRTRVLSFALEIEKLDPAAGDIAPGSAPRISSEHVATLAVTILGDGNTLAIGDHAKARNQVVEGDRRSLMDALSALGFDDEDLSALHNALDQDEATGTPMGTATQGWLSALKGRAISGTAAIGAESVGGVIGGLVLRYLGVA